MIRQALIGGDYGLINFKTGEPNPDYWATLLWNSLMGEMVYRVKPRGSQKLRVYLHSHPRRPEVLSLLVINLDRRREGVLQLPSTLSRPEEQFTVTAESLFGSEVYLNGKVLSLDDKLRLPDLSGLPVSPVVQAEEKKGKKAKEGGQGDVRVAPGSYGFFVVSSTGLSRGTE